MKFFEDVKFAPADPILGLNQAFAADMRENKVNLGAGVYKTADLNPFIFKTVKRAEEKLIQEESSKDYLPIDGDKDYVRLTKELVFGQNLPNIYGAQSVGGTGALRAGGAWLKTLGLKSIFISNPTWDNHDRIFKHAGLDVHTYPYLDKKKQSFDFKAVYSALKQIPPRSIILLQPSCHNPTGSDPSQQEWKELAALFKNNNLFAFFDFPYQGLGMDVEQDAFAIRHFLSEGLEFAVAVSHAKNFGLYAERTGSLFFVCRDEETAKKVGSRMKVIIRGLYSNPPCHGARIAAMILKDDELKKHWLQEVEAMKNRISEMRKTLVSQFQSKANREFDFLSHQRGMFSYTGLQRSQVDQLIADYAIYMTSDGRINVAGLNTENIDYVTDAILECVQKLGR